MRLRQAHAILETATALEAAGLGFLIWPVDHDREDLADEPYDDYITGYAEYTDPDHPDGNARTYRVDIQPCTDDHRISATLTFGHGYKAPCLKYEEINVWMDHDESVDPHFRRLVGTGLADRIAEVVRDHERPYRAAYEERTRRNNA